MSSNIGVIVVTYNACDVILECLQSLAQASLPDKLHLAVIDNASEDETVLHIETWLSAHHGLFASAEVTSLATNLGFAAGVNAGLTALTALPGLDRFWILNPDCIVPAAVPGKLAAFPKPFSILGHRITYAEPKERIQIDGGLINRWTGVTHNINLGAEDEFTPPPCSSDMDFISGASMVVSREFLEVAGSMPENYFLYYEEVDWAQRRGALPLAYCPDARVMHHAGTAIGSPTLARGASQLSLYFKHRSRLRYMRHYHPYRLPVAHIYGWLKLLQLLFKGQKQAAWAIFCGMYIARAPYAQDFPDRGPTACHSPPAVPRASGEPL